MFRQVMVCTFVEEASPEQRQAYRDAVEAIREIPELLEMKCGADAGHFEDNFDFVIVADFADFESARRYVAHPVHQTYVRDHASQLVNQRIIVQDDW